MTTKLKHYPITMKALGFVCIYYKYLLNENGKPIEPYIEDHADNPNESVMIFYDDIKIIEKRDV